MWIVFWMRHVQHSAVSGAVSHWYFADDKWRGLGHFPVVGSLAKVLRYHPGSVALGSFLTALLQTVSLSARARVRHGPPRPTGMWVRGGVLTIFKSTILGSTSWPRGPIMTE